MLKSIGYSAESPWSQSWKKESQTSADYLRLKFKVIGLLFRVSVAVIMSRIGVRVSVWD